MRRRIGIQATAILAWLVAAGMGLVAVLQTYEASRVLAALVIPINPDDAIASKHLIVLVPRVALIFLTIGWLVGIIILLIRCTRVEVEWRGLVIDFAKTTAIEIIIIGLASIIVYWLPGLVLGGKS